MTKIEKMADKIDGSDPGRAPTIPYEPPRVTSYTSEEILEKIGPAQACSPSPCPVGN
jgi:hypothetical protein